MFSTAILMKPSATCSALRPSPISLASVANAVAHRIGIERQVLRGSENLGKEIGDELADHDIGVGHRQRAAAAVAFRARDWRRRNPGRRETARRRNAGSSRRRPRRYGSASSARACARRRPRSRRRARIRRHNATRRSRCRPCRSRSSCVKPAERPVSAMPTTPPAGPDRIASLPRNNSAAVSPPDDIMNIRRMRRRPCCPDRPPPAPRSCARSATGSCRPPWYRRGRPA